MTWLIYLLSCLTTTRITNSLNSFLSETPLPPRGQLIDKLSLPHPKLSPSQLCPNHMEPGETNLLTLAPSSSRFVDLYPFAMIVSKNWARLSDVHSPLAWLVFVLLVRDGDGKDLVSAVLSMFDCFRFVDCVAGASGVVAWTGFQSELSPSDASSELDRFMTSWTLVVEISMYLMMRERSLA